MNDTWTITVRNRWGERVYFAWRLLFGWPRPSPDDAEWRESSKIGWMGDIGGTPYGPVDR